MQNDKTIQHGMDAGITDCSQGTQSEPDRQEAARLGEGISCPNPERLSASGEGENMVTIIITYAAGVPEILETCLASLERYDAGIPSKIQIVTDAFGYVEAMGEASKYPLLEPEVTAYEIGVYETGSEMHGKLLDLAVKDADTEFILTLDSDCFPVASKWLWYLMKMHNEEAFVTGILWPWIQPPKDLDEVTIEYKIRKYQSYRSTQVACQLIERDFLIENNVSFVGTRDTGFSVLDKVWEMGLTVGGLMPSRCALPQEGIEPTIDPEFNRMCCVVYGDMIYHHGAATRSVTTGNVDPMGYFDEARRRVIAEKDAGWLLKPENSHVYKFDKEEETAQFKMTAMYASMRLYLLTHDRLFEP